MIATLIFVVILVALFALGKLAIKSLIGSILAFIFIAGDFLYMTFTNQPIWIRIVLASAVLLWLWEVHESWVERQARKATIDQDNEKDQL